MNCPRIDHRDDCECRHCTGRCMCTPRPTLEDIRDLVDKQANDAALWGLHPDGTLPISEAYLQQELRRLHALIEEATD